MHILLTLAFAAGVLLLFLSVTRGEERPRAEGAGTERLGPLTKLAESAGTGLSELMFASTAAALLGAAAAQAVLGWPVMTAAAGAVGLVLPAWYFRQRAERRRAAVAEAIPEVVDALRDATRAGLGLEEALRAVARTAPAALMAPLADLERDVRLSGFEEALERARSRVADPAFDTLALALLMSYRVGGRNLAGVLDGLSHAVRAAVRARREVRAAQAQNVISARVIAALPLVLIVAIRAVNPDYLQVFSSPTGQAVLAVCLVSVAAGYIGMLRATALPERRRAVR